METKSEEQEARPRAFSPSAAKSRGRSLLTRGSFLWLLDFACLCSALYLGYWVRIGSGLFGGKGVVSIRHFIALFVISLAWTAIFAVEGLYRRAKVVAGLEQAISVVKSVTLGFLLLLGLSFVWRRYYFVETRGIVALGWGFSVAFLTLVRIGLVRAAIRRGMRHAEGVKRAAVVGALPFARKFINDRLPATNGYQVVGFVETREGEIASDLGPEYVLGRIGSLDDIVSTYEIEEIFLPIALLENRFCFDIVSRCSRTGLPVRLVSDIFEILMPDEPKEKVDGVPRSGLGEPALKGAGLVAKRIMDLVFSVLIIGVFAPLFLLIATLIKVLSPGPILFKQIRAGKDGRPFTFYKFRTMRHDIDDTLHREYATNFIGGKELRLKDERSDRKIYKMPNDPRITPIGRILRKTSLDELPQIFNVIKGDMSIVGPRPPIAYELTIYKEWHKRRLRAKPGITGLWQVSGRSSVPFHDMVLLDLYYINRWSLPLDLEIIVKTIPVVFSGKGAY
jgi:exopolysaccharide biosynthesis polyprenyl glycosylphosphotransferase